MRKRYNIAHKVMALLLSAACFAMLLPSIPIAHALPITATTTGGAVIPIMHDELFQTRELLPGEYSTSLMRGDGRNPVTGTFTMVPNKIYRFTVYGATGGVVAGNQTGVNKGLAVGWYSTMGNTSDITAYYHVGGVGGYAMSKTDPLPGCDGLGGYNGGGNGSAGSTVYARGPGGGGATDIRIGGNTLAHRVIVAGGNGGGQVGGMEAGGVGGGFNGDLGVGGVGVGGGGGTQTGGGAGGGGATAGTLGTGGTGGTVYHNIYMEPGGGGGGGYYGGGGSGGNLYTKSGGGGSGFVGKVDGLLDFPAHTQSAGRAWQYSLEDPRIPGAIDGNGEISVTEFDPYIGVFYHVNGGIGASPYRHNTGVSLLDPPAYDVPIFGTGAPVNFTHSTGAPLLCWNTEPDGTGISYMPGDVIPELYESLRLYAIWEIYNITEKYVSEAGTDLAPPIADTVQKVNGGTTYSKTISSAGTNQVLGWKWDSPPSSPTDYTPGNPSNEAVTADRTIYYVCRASYVITEKHVLKDGNQLIPPKADTTMLVYQGDDYTKTIPKAPGCISLGWKWDAPPATPTDFTTGDPTRLPVSADRTIYYVYEPNYLAIDLGNSDTSLQGAVANYWTAYYEYNTTTHTLTIKQDPPPGYSSYLIWQSGTHTVESISVASGVTTEIIVNGITVTSNTAVNRAPLNIAAGAHPNLVLADENTFSSNRNSGILNVPAGAELTISGNGSAAVTATGSTVAVINNGDIYITEEAAVTATPYSSYSAVNGTGSLALSGNAVLNTNAASREGIIAASITIEDSAVLNAKSNSTSYPAIIADSITVSGHGGLRTSPLASNGSGINIRAGGFFKAEDYAVVEVTGAGSNGYGITNNGTLTFKDNASVTISTSGSNGHGINNAATGTATIRDHAEVTCSTASTAAAIYNLGSFLIRDDTVVKATANYSSGTVHHNGTSFTIQDRASVTAAGGTGSAVAIYVNSNRELSITGGTVDATTGSSNQAAINLQTNAILTISGGAVTVAETNTSNNICAINGTTGSTLNVSGGMLEATGGGGIQCAIVNISGDAKVYAAGRFASGNYGKGIGASTSLTITGSACVMAKAGSTYAIGSDNGAGLVIIDDSATVYAYSTYINSRPAIYTNSGNSSSAWYVNAFFNPALAPSYDPYTLKVYKAGDELIELEGWRAFAFHLPGMAFSVDYAIFLENADLTAEVLRVRDSDPVIYSVNAPTGYSAHTGTLGSLPVKLGRSFYSITEKYVNRHGVEIAPTTTTQVAQGGTYSRTMPFITDYGAMGWLWAEDYDLLAPPNPPLRKANYTAGNPANLAVTGSRTIYFVYYEIDFVPTSLRLPGVWGMLLMAAMALLLLAASFGWQVYKRRKMN